MIWTLLLSLVIGMAFGNAISRFLIDGQRVSAGLSVAGFLAFIVFIFASGG